MAKETAAQRAQRLAEEQRQREEEQRRQEEARKEAERQEIRRLAVELESEISQTFAVLKGVAEEISTSYQGIWSEIAYRRYSDAIETAQQETQKLRNV